MELKTIISELKDLESGLCFLTEEHLEAIKVALANAVRLEKANSNFLYGTLKTRISDIVTEAISKEFWEERQAEKRQLLTDVEHKIFGEVVKQGEAIVKYLGAGNER